jgi:hypothetical protein
MFRFDRYTLVAIILLVVVAVAVLVLPLSRLLVAGVAAAIGTVFVAQRLQRNREHADARAGRHYAPVQEQREVGR